MGQPNVPKTKSPVSRSRKWGLYLLATIGVLAGVLFRGPIVDLLRGDTRKALSRAERHLDWAQEQSSLAVRKHLTSLDTFFEDVKKNTPAFAADALGWGSKWRIVVDGLPGTRPDRNDTYLRDRFGEHLFTPDRLVQAVQSVIKSYNDSAESIEGEMLVKIRVDTADLPLGSLPDFATKEALEKAFVSALETAAKKAQVGLGNDIFRELGSIIASEVLVLVAVRMGVSAGIITTGAGSSAVTLGVGLVACLIVDRIVSWVWNWYTDPVGDLTKLVNTKLDEIHSSIVKGDGPKKPGLRAKLLELNDKRNLARRQAIRDLITGKGQP